MISGFHRFCSTIAWTNRRACGRKVPLQYLAKLTCTRHRTQQSTTVVYATDALQNPSRFSSSCRMSRWIPLTTSTPSRHFRYYHRHAPQPSSPEVAELLSKYAAITPARQLNLSTLLSFGRPLTPESILASVNYVLSEIPRRLATRVRSLEALPFIVGTNPYVASTLNAYRESFRWLATYPTVTSLVANARFVEKLEDLVQSHANDIPTMAKGYA